MAFPGRHVIVFVVQRSQVWGSFGQLSVHRCKNGIISSTGQPPFSGIFGNMKNPVIILGCLIWWSAQVFAQVSAQPKPMEWPHHKKATIVLTYDDALLSQLDTAVPQLKNAGFKATFFLTSDID